MPILLIQAVAFPCYFLCFAARQSDDVLANWEMAAALVSKKICLKR